MLVIPQLRRRELYQCDGASVAYVLGYSTNLHSYGINIWLKEVLQKLSYFLQEDQFFLTSLRSRRFNLLSNHSLRS